VLCRDFGVPGARRDQPLICASSHQSIAERSAPPASRFTRLPATSARPAWSRWTARKSPSSIRWLLARKRFSWSWRHSSAATRTAPIYWSASKLNRVRAADPRSAGAGLACLATLARSAWQPGLARARLSLFKSAPPTKPPVLKISRLLTGSTDQRGCRGADARASASALRVGLFGTQTAWSRNCVTAAKHHLDRSARGT